jgi:hypothetical protein
MRKWENGKMGRWEDGKMRRWENGKMGSGNAKDSDGTGFRDKACLVFMLYRKWLMVN